MPTGQVLVVGELATVRRGVDRRRACLLVPRGVAAAVRALALSITTVMLIILYRLILFFTVLYTV